jgi:hypothetical protein
VRFPFVRHPLLRGALACVWAWAVAGAPAYGQRQSSDSNVGYIDSAIPGTMWRERFDAAYRDLRPTRAEFFYPQGAPGGPGVPMPERRVDYQELSSYFEAAFGPNFSAFVDVPTRFLNPEVNANTAGLGDINAGFKLALWATDDLVTTFQLRTYAPTGDAHRGLGTRHVSLEPALLLYARLEERLTLEGELRYWAPVGGTDFAGDVVRYGLGLGYGRRDPEGWWVSPVVELVGWTVLGGKESFVTPAGQAVVVGAAGDTIVNAKAGLRVGLGNRADAYAGYGRALTGDTWYKDIWRLEFRLHF